MDGTTGNVLWQTWTAFNVFSLYCTEDLNGDEHVDCVAAGRGGVNILNIYSFNMQLNYLLKKARHIYKWCKW